MKKVLFALFIAAGLTACGGTASTEATSDSTTVVVDSTTVETPSLPPAGTNTDIDSTSVVK